MGVGNECHWILKGPTLNYSYALAGAKPQLTTSSSVSNSSQECVLQDTWLRIEIKLADVLLLSNVGKVPLAALSISEVAAMTLWNRQERYSLLLSQGTKTLTKALLSKRSFSIF